MSNYIIKLDPAVYPGGEPDARSAIENAGLVVLKQFRLSLMFEVSGVEATISGLPGLVYHEDRDNAYNVSLQSLNKDHLKLTVDPLNQTVYNPKYTGAGVEIFLVDTGIKSTHTEFQGATINNLYTNFEGDFDDVVGHGTAMASLIVGQNIGAAPDATLHNVKLFDVASGTATIGEILIALNEIIGYHLDSDNLDKVKIVCLPWVSDFNQLINDAVSTMTFLGVIVVCAAGNSGIDLSGVSPASVRNAITVGAFNRNFEVTAFTNTPWTGEEPTSGSFVNYGSALDVFALGVDVTTASIAGNEDYILASGTSVASAITAGVISHYVQWYPDRTTGQLREIFLSEGHHLGTSNLVFDNQNSNVDYSQVYPAIATTENLGQNSLTTKPSGRLINVKQGETVQTDIGLNPNATDVEILNFAPLPPWITVDLATGNVSVDAQGFTTESVPGIYMFAMKGTIADEVLVEEFAVGVYAEEQSELVEEGTSSFYYDAGNASYDEVVSYALSKN